jgi:hypothetical protein
VFFARQDDFPGASYGQRATAAKKGKTPVSVLVGVKVLNSRQ